MEKKVELVQRVAEVYDWLDSAIAAEAELTGACKACGRCCDFDGFDHRLFVTTVELLYLKAQLTNEDVKAPVGSRCPYQIDGRCTVYEHRFAGCRVFYCGADREFQSRLSESALDRLKVICADLLISYRYMDVLSGLKDL